MPNKKETELEKLFHLQSVFAKDFIRNHERKGHTVTSVDFCGKSRVGIYLHCLTCGKRKIVTSEKGGKK